MVAVAARWRWALVAIVVLVALADTALARYLARALKRPMRYAPGGQLALAGGGSMGALSGGPDSPLA